MATKFDEAISTAIDLSERSAALARNFHAAAVAAAVPEDQTFQLGLAAYQVSEYEVAENCFRLSHAVAPTAEKAARIGLSAWRRGDLTRARLALEEANELDPGGVIRAHTLGTDVGLRSALAGVELAAGNVGRAL